MGRTHTHAQNQLSGGQKRHIPHCNLTRLPDHIITLDMHCQRNQIKKFTAKEETGLCCIQEMDSSTTLIKFCCILLGYMELAMTIYLREINSRYVNLLSAELYCSY